MFPENHEEDVALYMSSDNGITFHKLKPIEDIETINVSNLSNGGVVGAGTCEVKIKNDDISAIVDLVAKGFNNTYEALKTNLPRIFKQITYHPRFLINKEKRVVFLQYYFTKIVVKCHEEDNFDWKIGLGLALSNANAINVNKAKAHRNIWFRNKKTHKLDYKKYANWVLTEYYRNDMEDLYNLEQRVKQAKDKEFIEL